MGRPAPSRSRATRRQWFLFIWRTFSPSMMSAAGCGSSAGRSPGSGSRRQRAVPCKQRTLCGLCGSGVPAHAGPFKHCEPAFGGKRVVLKQITWEFAVRDLPLPAYGGGTEKQTLIFIGVFLCLNRPATRHIVFPPNQLVLRGQLFCPL